MTHHHLDDLVVTDAEWQALLEGARALRELATALRNAGFNRVAVENDGHAATLQGLVQRVTVAATRSADREGGGQPAQPEAER